MFRNSVCSRTSRGWPRCGGQIQVYEPDLLSLCQAITCTVVSTDCEIEIRALCATYQHEHRVTVPQTFCPNNHSKNWEGKLCFANGWSKIFPVSFQKQLQELVLEKTTGHRQGLFLHLTSLTELTHGPPCSPLPTTTFTSLSLYPSTGDTGSPWGQGVAPVSPRSDRSRGSQVNLDGPLLILPLRAINSSILCDPRPPTALPHLCPLPSTGCSLPSADHCLPVNCSV